MQLETIKYPPVSTDLSGSWTRLLRVFGPGAIIASVTAGTGETIFAPRVGAVFGYANLWAPGRGRFQGRPGLRRRHGHFSIPLASALSHEQRARNLLAENQIDQAREEAEAAIAAYPDCVPSQVLLGDMMMIKRSVEARAAYQKALTLAQTVEPEFRLQWIPILKHKLAEVSDSRPE